MDQQIQIGQAIAARRKIPSNIYHNLIVGPVVEVYQNACRIQTNTGSPLESDWQIFFRDWDIEILFTE